MKEYFKKFFVYFNRSKDFSVPAWNAKKKSLKEIKKSLRIEMNGKIFGLQNTDEQFKCKIFKCELRNRTLFRQLNIRSCIP